VQGMFEIEVEELRSAHDATLPLLFG
jgi:hypothetical protein